MELLSLDHQKAMAILPDRDPQAHKGNFGRVLLLCGSTGYTGAAALAAMGALRCGSGLVYLGVPRSIYMIEAIKLNEAIVFPLEDENGALCDGAMEQILSRLHGMDAVLIGPGLGNGDAIFRITEQVLKQYRGPVVVDADGINTLCGHIDLLRDRTSPTVLTPHPGEMRRLIAEAYTDPIQAAVNLSAQSGAIVVLKGHETVITDGKQAYINHTGNPGMAVGGSGDVLAGMIASLIGQGIPALEASACAVWFHGAAGDLCARELGQYGMLPSDMLQVLPRLMK